MDLRMVYRDLNCPVCGDDLIFSNDYSKANCRKQDCNFNNMMKYFIGGRQSGKTFFMNEAVKHAKESKLDFNVYKPGIVEVYEKGELVRTIETKKKSK